MSDRYNGWKNRETWLVNVWFNPETQSDLDSIKDMLESDVATLPDYLKDFVYIDSIDWDELAEHVSDINEEV